MSKIFGNYNGNLVLQRIWLPIIFLAFFMGVSVLGANSALAQASSIISIQGKIVNQVDGTNIEVGVPSCVLIGADTCDVRASVYDESSGGNLLWSETHTNLELGDRGGIFNLSLNESCNSWETPIASGNCNGGAGVTWGNDPTIYVQIEFDDDGNGDFAGAEVFSRSLFSSVPFAYYAENAIGLLDGFDTVYDSDPDKILDVDDPLGMGFVSSVAGDIYFDLTSTGNMTVLDNGSAFFTFTDTGGVVIELDATDSPSVEITNLGTSSSFVVSDEASDTSPFVIDSSGNVGIGVAIPTNALVVAGDVEFLSNMIVGAGGTPDLPLDGNDAYITGTLEVDGLVDLGSNFQLNNNEALGFRVENADSGVSLPVCNGLNQGRLYYDTATDAGYICTETSLATYEWFNYTPDPSIVSYGEMYTTDSVTSEAIGSTYAKLIALGTAGDSSNMTVDAANNRIIIDEDGAYIVDLTYSFGSGANNRDYDFAIAINGVVQPDLQAAHTAASNGDRVSFAIVGIAVVSAGDIIELYGMVNSATTINAIDGNLRLMSANVGGSGGGGTSNLDTIYDADGDKTLLVDNISGLEFVSSVAGNITFDLQSSGDFVIENNNSAVLTVQDNGSVGIGTSSAIQPVEIVSNASAGDSGGVLLVEAGVDRIALRVENSDGIASALPLIQGVGDNSADLTYISLITGDSFSRISVSAGGVLEWGSGAATTDTNLYRSAADTLRTDDNFVVGSVLSIDNNGSAANPALYFVSDTDTGFFHTADVIGITSGGSEQLRITPRGLRFTGKTSDPVTSQDGDIWYRSDLNNFKIFAGGRSQTLGTVSIAQAYQATSSLINTSGNTDIPWNGTGATRIIDSGYSHNPAVQAGRVNIIYGGLYSLSYNVAWDTSSNSSKTVSCLVERNGSPMATGVGSSHSFGLNDTDDRSSNSAEFLFQFAAGDYYEVVCTSTGGAGNINTIGGQSWTKIEFIR